MAQVMYGGFNVKE